MDRTDIYRLTTQIFPGERGPLIFGHRGFSHLAPENTPAAFGLLLDYNIPGVELDVHLCRSGEVVVVHDHNLLRLSGFDGFVEETDYTFLKTLDVGSHMGVRFKGERIPLLSDVFDLLKDRVYYDIELKTRRFVRGALEEKVIKIVNDYGLQSRVLFSSFNPFCLKALKAFGWARSAIIYSISKKLPFYLRHGEGRLIAGCPIIKPHWEILGNRPFHFVKKRSAFPVITWTVDDPEAGKRLIHAGVAGIISNNPAIHMKKE
jgi:glycerophosphoryl diester phosphodiesterase